MSTAHGDKETITEDGKAATVIIRGLHRSYGARTVLDGIDLTLAPGEFVALLGRSGCGKTTLLRALAGLDHDTAGSGRIEVPDRRAVVFQDARLLPWKRTLANVTLGLYDADARSPRIAGRGGGARSTRAAARRLGEQALAEVGLTGRADAWPGQLSGGEQQRAALARALIRQPQLLLADEPFGALDALTRLQMHALLRTLHTRHRPAILMITHDVDEALALADRVILLTDGRISLDLPLPRHLPAGPDLLDPSDQPDLQEERARLLAALGVQLPTPVAETQARNHPNTHKDGKIDQGFHGA